MFEWLIALKYLLPRRQQLSVALISLVSVLVISLVVWLLVVFLSVTEGMERGWLKKLTTLNAPLRVTPTPHYYGSYYYRIDEMSGASGYQAKGLAEKRMALRSDPYEEGVDGELPRSFPAPDRGVGGSLRDPVKGLFAALETLKGKRPDLAFQDFQLGGALLRLQLIREVEDSRELQQSFLTQASYLSTFPDKCPNIASLLTPPTLATSLSDWFVSLKREDTQGAGVLLAKSYRDNGVAIGDRGYLAYSSATLQTAQEEQRLPIFVAGFYDPGVLSIGTKAILVPPYVTDAMRASNTSFALDRTQSNGVMVWFDALDKAREVGEELRELLAKGSLSAYWNVTPFYEYDFAKDLLQQFQSDKYLFTLVGVIILMVACCNIVSLLVLLVNDKKKEIGILQAMGASTASIARIFGTCGVLMGALGSLVGSVAAVLTLRHIDAIAQFLSFLQGHEAFNVHFFGTSLPKELSSDALLFVLIATPLLSLVAGLVPALKACRLRPSEMLRSE